MSRSALATAIVALALAGGLAGCANPDSLGTGGTGEAGSTAEPPTPSGGSGSLVCLDWGHFDSPPAAAADAGAVVRGTVVEQDGTAQVFGVEANRWLVDVADVLERPDPENGAAEQPRIVVSPGDRIAVVSTPESCGGDGRYPEGDPLDPATGLGGEDGSVIVLLSAADLAEEPEETWDAPSSDGDLFLLTPYQGVVTPAADGSLPAEWPAP